MAVLNLDCSNEPDAGPGGLWTQITVRIEQQGPARVDIVVLVDNSGSMAQEQVALTQRFPELISELVDPSDRDGDTRPDHPAVEDLNIGIIDPDMGTGGYRVSTCMDSDSGDNGCFRNTPSPAVPGCETTYPAFLSRNETNAASYHAATMAQDFACIATLGTNGCGWEQHFKAMRAATTTNPEVGVCNRGFLRPDALLALIFVTDEDDCSVRPDHSEMFDNDRHDLGHLNLRCLLHDEFVESVTEYVTAFRDLKPADPSSVVLGMIIGVPPDESACIGAGDEIDGCLGVAAMQEQVDPTAPTQLIPSCDTMMGRALPPRRFVTMAQAFGSSAVVDSICKTDWTDAISGITDKLVGRLASPCFRRGLEFDPVSCTANCVAVETLSDSRACAEDPECPSYGCAPLDVDNLGTNGLLTDVPPCTNPGSGESCQPSKRDLGVAEYGDGLRRLCLLRQAARSSAAGTCAEPTEPGWWYIPAEASSHQPPCPEVQFASEPESIIEDGSAVELRCLVRNCPEERECGPASDPLAECCPDGSTCTADPEGGAGTCS